tara:strand:+ start:831 stop:1973 length:1143 start_codon:yes stop_codon:yes gene_type:complete
MHNTVVTKYDEHIAIIGAGISGLTLGISLKQNNIPCVIFEKSPTISEHGAGISISPNGKHILSKLNVLDELKKVSGNTDETIFFSNLKEITKISSDVLTTSRKSLHDILLNKFTSLDGEILFDYELENINLDLKEISFKNGKSLNVRHIASCDGIKSICRSKAIDSSFPKYSGYSVWRSIINQKQSHIGFYLGAGFHIVSYPINSQQTSFVAAVKTNNQIKESWMTKGSYSDLQNDIPNEILKKFSCLKESSEIYKWGVFIRPKTKTLYRKNITFFGDAAHPIVPFIGQGGCMAIEDAYIFSNLYIKNNYNISKTQEEYQFIRLDRINKITQSSLSQGKLNHLKNPLLVFARNFVMKNTNIIKHMTTKIWGYRPESDIHF